MYVTDVASNGVVHIRIESASYKALQDLLVIAKQRTSEILGVSNEVTIDLTKLYLAKFSENGEWYRVAPRTLQRNKNDEVSGIVNDAGLRCPFNIIPIFLNVNRANVEIKSLLDYTYTCSYFFFRLDTPC